MTEEVILFLLFCNKGHIFWCSGCFAILWSIYLERTSKIFRGAKMSRKRFGSS